MCGEKKTARARTCRKCYAVLGREITRRVDAVRQASDAAENGHLASQNQNTEMPVARNVVWGPVLAQVKISKDAAYCIPSRGGISNYWECKKSVKGGFVSLFVFVDGVEEMDVKAGDTITARVELKTKDTQRGKVSYLRAQAVEEGVRSNIKLVVDRYHANYIPILPSAQIAEQGRRFSVGFVPA